MSMKYAIQISGLRKNYGSTEVLKGIDFQVKKGEIFGILGVNGAGKTTTLECIEGFRGYDSGEIRVDGKIGIQLQSASLPAYIKAGEAVRLFAKWNHAKPEPARLSALGISELEKRRYMELSTGQKRRLHLALALTGDPDILFLDEPTAGLDVEGRVCLHKEIFRLKEQGRTIVMASHDMTEVENLCSRIAILNGGKNRVLRYNRGTGREDGQTLRYQGYNRTGGGCILCGGYRRRADKNPGRI